MKEKRYYFSNFPTEYLLMLLDQKERQKLQFKAKYLEKNDLKTFNKIKYLEILTMLIRECLTERFLKEDMSLNKCGSLLLKSKKSKREILRNVFTIKVVEKEELIDLEMLKKIINELSIDNLQAIINTNRESTVVSYAKFRFDELLFEVDEEIKNELKQKILNDRNN